MADDRELDELLDRALASYVDEEPDQTLKKRILSRAADSGIRRRRIAAALPALLAAAACVIAIVLLARSFKIEKDSPAPMVSSIPGNTSPRAHVPAPQHTGLSAPASHGTVLRITKHASSHSTSERATPKSGAFPTPSPLSPEEKALLSLVTAHPEQARQALAPPAADPLESAPVTIAPIHIAALSDAQETPYRQ